VLARMADVTGARERMTSVMEAVLEVVAERGVLLGRLFQTRRAGGALEDARRRRQRFVEDYFVEMMVRDGGVPAARAAVAVPLWLAAVNGTIESWAGRGAPTHEVTDVFARMVAGSIDALRTP
jgi:AcrR family transcriptional regulator